MHEYYRNNILKLKKENEGYLRFVKVELEQNAGKPYSEVWEEIWGFYEKNLLEHFPYIGGDKNHAAACRGLRLYLSYSRLPTVRFRKKIRLRRIYALSLQFGLCDVRRVGRTAVPKAYLLCQRRLL